MDYNEYTKRAYDTACKHGFHDQEQPNEHWLMLVITEVAEMVEADRKGRRAHKEMFKHNITTKQPREQKKAHWCFCFETFIKDSFEDEMADACIRLLDLAGLRGIEVDSFRYFPEDVLQEYRETSVTEKAFNLCRILSSMFSESLKMRIESALYFVECWAKSECIDLEWYIAQKMEYNEQRARLHGKKY